MNDRKEAPCAPAEGELRKSRIPGWQEEERLPVDKVLGLMEKAYTMGKDDAQA